MGKATKVNWDDFRNSGLVVIINQLLHVFGWAICFSVDKDGKAVECFPKRTKFRGFSEEDQDEAYTKVTKYMKDNIDELIDDVSPPGVIDLQDGTKTNNEDWPTMRPTEQDKVFKG